MNFIAVSTMMVLLGVTLATGMVARKRESGRSTIQKLPSEVDLANDIYKSLGHGEHSVRKLHTRSLAHSVHLSHKGLGDLYQQSRQMHTGIPFFKYFINVFKKLPLLGQKIRSLFKKLTQPHFTHITPDGKKKYLELKKKYNFPDMKTLKENAIPRKKEILNGKSDFKAKDLDKRLHNHYQRRDGTGYRPNTMKRNKFHNSVHKNYRKHPEVDVTRRNSKKYPEVDHRSRNPKNHPEVDLTHQHQKPRERFHYAKRAFTEDKYNMKNVKLDYSNVEKDLKSDLKNKHNKRKLDNINHANEHNNGWKDNQNKQKGENTNPKRDLKDKQNNLYKNNFNKNTNNDNESKKKNMFKGKPHYGKRRFTMDKYGMENIKFDYSKVSKDLKDSKKELKNGPKLNNGVKNGSKLNTNIKNEVENIKNGKSEKSNKINSKTE